MSRYISVEVEVSITDIDDDDLIDELESRGYKVSVKAEPESDGLSNDPYFDREELERLFMAVRAGRNDELRIIVSDLVWEKTGRIV